MATTLSELRAAMVRLRELLWSQIKTMEVDLRKDPFPHSLLSDLWNTESEWSKVEKCHSDILAVTEGEQAQNERLAHEEFRVYYINVNDRVQDAIGDNRSKEEVRVQNQRKVSKVHVLGDRWKRAYIHIGASLDELMVRLDGELTIGMDNLRS